MKKLLVLSGFITALLFTQLAHASINKVTWCHTEPNGNQETLQLPQQALEQAGHVDANGNPLHAGDHAGECEELTPTSEPTNSPTIEVSPTAVVSPTSSPSANPTPTDSPTEHKDGYFDDHLGCGMHSCGVDNRSGQPILPPSQSGK